MIRNDFITKANEKLKLVRTEYNLNQEKMAWKLGISKKTLIEIEKGRASLGWTGSVALCSIFSESEILASAFGGQPDDLIKLLAFEGQPFERPGTMGGKIWWRDIKQQNGYKIQQNYISQHYRILDEKDRRVSSSFDYSQIKESFQDAVSNERDPYNAV